MKKDRKKILNSGSKEINEFGLGDKIFDETQRVINKDGSFNVKKRGLPFWETFSVYQWLITMSWIKFCSLILVTYLLVNIFFAGLYFIGGDSNFEGIETQDNFDRFLNEFFFSTQTFTTVGYGRINPVGVYSNIISSIESLIGLLSLALATGLLFGRFARPVAKILYSDTALIAPYKNISAFQFRIANKRAHHQMMDAEVDVLISKSESGKNKIYSLNLEYRKITFFSATWTVNHPIDEDSPLYGMTEQDLKNADAEFFILFKGFDDTFAQIVHSRSSYKFNEVTWGAKFVNTYSRHEEGNVVIELDKISEYEKSELPEENFIKV